jgi:hypothetical protein
MMGQLKELERLLRKQHFEATKHRVAVGLDLLPDQVTQHLSRALRLFTANKLVVFDWLEQSWDQCQLPASKQKIAEDIWIHFFRHFPSSTPAVTFANALQAFSKHLAFCIRLHLSRHSPIGRAVGSIPCALEDCIREIDSSI